MIGDSYTTPTTDVTALFPDFSEVAASWMNENFAILFSGNDNNKSTLLVVKSQQCANANQKQFAKVLDYLNNKKFIEPKIAIQSSKGIELIDVDSYAPPMIIAAIMIPAAPIVMIEALFEYGLLYANEVHAAKMAFKSPQAVLPYGLENFGGSR